MNRLNISQADTSSSLEYSTFSKKFMQNVRKEEKKGEIRKNKTTVTCFSYLFPFEFWIFSTFCLRTYYFILLVDEEQVDLRIFGSCATGLSLPTSDIDLGITGFEAHPRTDLIYVLINLANVLEKLPWVKSIERIFTANIPIIKMVSSRKKQLWD